ncbi:MAG: DNA topoisomerase I [Candidatus Berkelbacteria bacterium Licking1014_7]|uniref:DNA topoisomerase 1 n=1 Tax=Candidatus Berkelbacteria bacterium Licking1014_7 TaxID=2017147 RepID=A0A554LHW0_9BACT|nr:MAG: DNA topoisomerase I [Candidatus Berkelbacteria bacterium Licking1014_7]
MNILVVESPAKSRTLQNFLGSDYKISACFGHVRDLPKKELGVETENGFKPKYVITPGRRKNIASFKRDFAAAEKIYLATDLDREGEAISWHILKATNGDKKYSQKVYRIVFNEITKTAVLDAIKNPGQINMDLVNAQQARRILDRLVGYKLSPFLWKKVMKGLSAGRVQSVAVRLIVEREIEIENFQPDEYWEIWAHLLNLKNEKLPAKLVAKQGKKIDKLEIKNESGSREIIRDLKNAQYIVKDLIQEGKEKYSMPPYTTSTLQQDAGYKLRMSAKQVMRQAQDLYEAGKITYMRTDNVNMSWLAINSIRKYIGEEIGKDYLPEKPRGFKTKTKGAQEAHEAIRPTYFKNQKLESKNKKFTDGHAKLYDLIWRRAVASQVKPAILDTQKVAITAGKYDFEANGQTIKFDGFTKIYPMKLTENDLPEVKKGDTLTLEKLDPTQHFTQPPIRFNQASLIKKLEEMGIGRPSTYATIIDTILRRDYAVFQNRYFIPTDIARVVTKMLVENFSEVVDYGFTAQMEENLDKIAEGKEKWQKVLGDFYFPFEKKLKMKEAEVQNQQVKVEGEGEPCPQCGQGLVVKSGKFGKFLACPGYPDCRFTKNVVSKIGMKCPDCQEGEVVERRSKKGKMFFGCDKFPVCKFVSWERPAPPVAGKS